MEGRSTGGRSSAGATLPVGAEGGHRTVGTSGAGAAATRPRRAGGPAGGRRTSVGRSGAAAFRPRQAGGRVSHERCFRRSRHPAMSRRRVAVARSVGSELPPPGPSGRREAIAWRSVRRSRRTARRADGRPSHCWSGAAATRPRRAAGRPSQGRFVHCRRRHAAPSGPREAVARSVGPAQPPTCHVGPAGRPPTGGINSHGCLSSAATNWPRRAGGRPSHGQSVRCCRYSAPSGRRVAVSRSVGPVQPPPGPVGPAGGRRTIGNSGAAATRPRRAIGRPSHDRSVWRSCHPAPSCRWEAIARSVDPAQPLPGHVEEGGHRSVGPSGAAASWGHREAIAGSVSRAQCHPAPSGRPEAVTRSVGPARGR